MAAFSVLDLNTFKWWTMFLVETLSQAVIRGEHHPDDVTLRLESCKNDADGHTNVHFGNGKL